MEQAIDRLAFVFRGSTITNFRDVAHAVDTLTVRGAPLHAAIRYGVTQALLAASPRPDPEAPKTRRLLQGDIPSPMAPISSRSAMRDPSSA